MRKAGAGLIGATSFVGERVACLLGRAGIPVTPFSRQGGAGTVSLSLDRPVGIIENWICAAPVWTLPEHFRLLEIHGIQRLVAFSSTSRFTKEFSPSSAERELAARLRQGEEKILAWAEEHGCTVVILQPTMIYGYGRDKNVTAIARCITRLGFFPLLGRGEGLRQPVHVDDVAAACVAALEVPAGTRRSYVLSGAEVVTYRVMVERIFAGLGRKPRFAPCPLAVFILGVRLARLLPRYRGLTTEMAVRMNKNQAFEHREAAEDLGFRPRPFLPECPD